MTRLQFVTILSSLATFALHANCATVELSNGYKIEGKIISRDETALKLDSTLMGRIDIPLGNVAKITEDANTQAAAQTPTQPPVTVAAPPPPPPHKSDVDTFLESVYFLEGWKTDLALGLGYVSGVKDSASSSISFSTEHKWTQSEVRFELLQQYEQTTDSEGNDDVSKDMLKTLGRYRNNFSERFFWQSETQYSYDNIKEIDHDMRESLGLGWRVLKTKRLNLALTPAITIQKQVIQGEDKDLTYSPTFFEEFTFDLTKSTSLRQEFSVLFPVNGSDDNSYHFSLMMKSMLSDHLSFNILYLYDSDGSVPKDIEPGQSSLNMLLGVSF